MMQGLTVDTINKLETMAVAAHGAAGKAATLDLEAEPAHVYGLITNDGKYERVEAAPGPRSHDLVSLDEAVLFAKEKGNPSETVVWFDSEGVVIVLKDETRRDRATLTLTTTPQFDLLVKLQNDQPMFDQRDFRRLLKVQLSGCLRDNVLVNWVSDMQFTSQGEARGQLGHGRDSMGKDIEATAASDIGLCPEEIILDVRVFDDPAQKGRWAVKCAVEVLTREQKFRLVPLPLELHNAMEDELFVVGQKLREGLECKVYRGTP